MDDLLFFNSFHFNEFSYARRHHRDNSAGVAHHYIGYMKNGSGLIISDNTQLNLTPGTLFYIPRGCRYHSYWTPEDIVRFDSLGFDYFPTTSERRYCLQKLPCTGEILAALEPLSRDKTVSAVSVGRLYLLLGLLEPEMQAETLPLKNSLTDAALQILHEDPRISMDRLAESCRVSQATLYNTFRRVLGKTPNRVRQELLCQQATRLLVTTNLSVEEISHQCGFSSASYFRKVLFSVMGKTPRQIRGEASVL